ncbi:MAG: hypothetical protein ABR543_04835 [Gemmatimonadaceae bacterium]
MSIANCKTTPLATAAFLVALLAACDGREERILAVSGGPGGGTATIQKVQGDGQSAPAGTALRDTLMVRITNANGSPSINTTVTWTVIAGGGFIAPSSGPTDSLGLARATWALGPTAGANTATASAPAVSGSPLTFTATAR